LQFSLQAATPETFGYTLAYFSIIVVNLVNAVSVSEAMHTSRVLFISTILAFVRTEVIIGVRGTGTAFYVV